MSDNIKWEASNFQDKGALYDLFEKSNYTLGKGEPVDPEFVFGKDKSQLTENVESIYQLVNEEDDEFQIWLINSSEECRKKSWRKLIINIVKQWVAEYVIFITEDFKEFWIEIIADEIDEELIFEPSSPSSKADKFVQDLLNRRPLFDPKGLTASQLQAKHELTASKLIKAIETNDEKKIRLLFQRAGLCSYADMDLICSREDAPLKKAIVEINFSKDNKEEWINKNLAKILGGFRSKKKSDLNWIILIGKEGISYISENGIIYSSIEYPGKNEELVKLLTSLIANIDIRAAFNGETFESQFGPYSPFFSKSNYLMEIYLKQYENDLKVIREEWERYFGKVYQEGDVDEQLFIKHSYLSLLIKNVLFCKYLPEKVVESAESFVELSEYFESRGVELFFNDFYAWANNIRDLREDIFQALNGAIYESDDIFRIIYQDMVSPITRHALGEFYTHPELAELMVDEVYTYGKFALDPACGSGTFLVEILKKIKEIAKSNEEVISAMKKLYGFDVNPIAVLVSKANLLLHMEEIETETIPINIFLTDSLNPIERNPQSDMIWGVHYTFSLGKIGDLIINSKFFQKKSKKDLHDYLQEFSEILLFIDEEMTKNADVNDIISDFDKKFQRKWLNDQIPSCPNSYRDNIHYIIKTLSELHSQKKNHIWLYLLYNSIGALLIKNKVELIIGNPPWVVVNSIFSKEYKEEVKKMGKDYNIFIGGKTATTTEITTLFIYKSLELFLIEDGVIFFVTPASLMTAGQHEKFRWFKDLKNIVFWDFDKDLFNIHNVCLKAEKGKQGEERLNPLVVHYQVNIDPLSFQKENEEKYKPEYIKDETKKSKSKITIVGKLVGKLNPASMKEDILLLPIEESTYHQEFNQGASLVPRNLIFIKLKEIGDENIEIVPDDSINPQKGSSWDFIAYTSAKIHKKFVLKAIKSTELIPFTIVGNSLVFIPLKISHSREGEHYEFCDLSEIDSVSKDHYNLLEDLFDKHKKAGASINSLKERLLYQGHLSKKMQRLPLRVIHNASGTIPKAAVLRDKDLIVDTTLYQCSCDSEDEVYYLLGIINSIILKDNIPRIASTGASGSTRHFHLHLWDFPFPKYTASKIQKKIVEQAKKCEKFVQEFIFSWINNAFTKNKGKACCNFCKSTLLLKNIENHLSNCKKRNSTSEREAEEWKVIESKEDIIIKPATIQNRLFQNESFDKLLKELNEMIKELMNI